MFDRLVHLNSPKNIESISFSMMYSPKKVLIRSNICRIRLSGRERVCTSLPPTPPDVPFGIRRFL
ncbi:hypothetical protein, partial [Sutterella wadsworthensis]|uniref:hypothetical protein n=1 Tax=Sutterella wadsworthensis TaxID=40545 RepID=UPI0019D064A0